MRVHPVGLFSHEATNDVIIENVMKSAKITHTHMDAGVNILLKIENYSKVEYKQSKLFHHYTVRTFLLNLDILI